jgi:quercetin dioxygenase-like cupin family protein
MKKASYVWDGKGADLEPKRVLLHDSPYFKYLCFNLAPGQEIPIHSHPAEGQVALTVVKGKGEFLTKEGTTPARAGEVMISDIEEPHGIRAATSLQVLVTIAPPI